MDGAVASDRPESDATGGHGMRASLCPSLSTSYGRLYFTLPGEAPPAPAMANPASSPLPAEEEEEGDVVRRGYLRRWEQPARAYFVLREGSHSGPGRLESYASEEEFVVARRSACHTLWPCGCGSKRVVVYLCCCLGVTKNDSCPNGHTVALYARGQTVVLVAEDQNDQCKWYLDVKRMVDEERRGGPRGGRQDSGDGEETPSGQGEGGGESFDREDDGYCTLTSNTFFKEVWSVSVKPCGLGLSMSMAGDACLCLSATSLVLLAADSAGGGGGGSPSLTFPLRSVRNLGHNGGFFFLEVGSLAPVGPGKIWLEARERGDLVQAQHMHEAIRETMRALRLLPDFSLSPSTTSSGHGQQQSRPRSQTRGQPPGANWSRDESGYMTMLSSPVTPPFRCPPGSPACASSPCSTPAGLSPHGRPGQAGGGGGYMVMSPGKLREFGSAEAQHHPFSARYAAAGGGEVYVMMQLQDGRRLSQSSDDAYVPMKSPLRPHSSPMTLFFNAGSHWAPHQSDRHTAESSQPVSACGRSSRLAQDQEVLVAGLQRANGRHIVPVQATPTSGAKEAVCVSGVTSPFRSDPERSTARRYRLSACLPSCLQARER